MLVFDVSEYNSGITLPKCDGLIARCTKKTNKEDPFFYVWKKVAFRRGIPFGAYKYTYAHNIEDARIEAVSVCQLLRGCNLELGFWLDIENDYHRACTDSLIKDIITMYKQVCENYSIKFAGVYCDFDFYKTHRNALQDCDIWLAKWTHDINKQPVMFDDDNVKGWQYTDNYNREKLNASLWKVPEQGQEHKQEKIIKYNPGNVRKLQEYLNKHYGYFLEVDGVMGTNTFTAICQSLAK